jgi:DNA-directed RNA polymerase specialized sigma24 family protein
VITFDRNAQQEARVRLLAGRRRWHREETFMACLDRTMKSILRDYWRRQQVPIVAVNDIAAGLRDAPDPEREAAARDELADISKALDDDKHTLEIAMARGRGDTPANIKSQFGLSDTEYASALKRLQRVALKRRSSGVQR